MDNPKISIVSPSFNQGIYIEDAIQSVLNQQYDNFEHIILHRRFLRFYSNYTLFMYKGSFFLNI